MAHEALESGCRQIVVLGAGLDTLAWRFKSACRCLELDHPATQEIKRRVVGDELSFIAVNLATESVADALRSATAFRANQPALFIAEGLLMYLPPARVASLFEELAESSAPGSRFAFTFMEARVGRPTGFQDSSPLISWWLRWRGEPFTWELARDEAKEFAERHGWQLASLSSPEEMRRHYLAPVGLGDAPLAVGESVALACRRDR